MVFRKYKPLQQQLSDSQSDGAPDYDDASPHRDKKTYAKWPWILIYTLFSMFVVSIAANMLLLTKLHTGPACKEVSSVASLEWNTPIPINYETPTLDDPIWNVPEFHWGYVALDHSFASAHGVLASQNWPWDHSRGIYVMQGFHSMHCLYVIRDSLVQFRDSKEQTWPEEHVAHCLQLLRNDLICLADDTPLFTGRFVKQGNESRYVRPGTGQTRICRDWNKLQKFSIERSACYGRPLDRYTAVLDRFKHCPDGSKPWLGKEMPVASK